MAKRHPSIMQSDKQCYQTGRTEGLHCHHIYGAANRKISDQHGFWIWLSPEWHNMDSRIDIHHNREFDLYVKRLCQLKYEETHSREEFMKLIGKSYL